MDRRGERLVSSKGFAPDRMLEKWEGGDVCCQKRRNGTIGEYEAVEMTNLWLLG